VGCGEGSNLIPASVTLPRTAFVGVDLSERAIERGCRTIGELGLRNVRLICRDLAAFEDGAPFDYIIAHGVWSWVPAPVRDALLERTRKLLAPSGVALISYNTYPGWYVRQIVREMALSAASGEEHPARQMMHAREFLAHVSERVSGGETWIRLVREEINGILERPDGALFHDDLAEVNSALYFRDFVRRAAEHGLQYLSEAEPGGSLKDAPGETRVDREQYADMITGRRFRSTLLCHAAVRVGEEPNPAAVMDLHAAGPLTVIRRSGKNNIEYHSPRGGIAAKPAPLIRILLDRIAAAWPSFIPVRDLLPAGEFSNGEACAALYACFAGKLIELRTAPPHLPRALSEKPAASPLARLQAARGETVTNLHHFQVNIDNDSLRRLLAILDGARDRAALIDEMSELYPAAGRKTTIHAVDQHLALLHESGVLSA